MSVRNELFVSHRVRVRDQKSKNKKTFGRRRTRDDNSSGNVSKKFGGESDHVGQSEHADQTLSDVRHVPAGNRFAVRRVRGVPGGDLRGRLGRVRVHDRPTVPHVRHENDGPDHRPVDGVPDRAVQVVLRGRVRPRVPRVPTALGRRARASRRRVRPDGGAPVRRRLPETVAGHQRRLRVHGTGRQRLSGAEHDKHDVFEKVTTV